MSKSDRIGKRYKEGILTAIAIIESYIWRCIENKEPTTNLDFEVWDVRVRYFG